MEETTGKSYTGYDLKRVDTVNLIATWSVAFVFILLNFTTDGFASGLGDMAKSLAVGLLATGLYFLKLNRFVKSLLFGLIPFLAMMALFVISGFVLGTIISSMRPLPWWRSTSTND